MNRENFLTALKKVALAPELYLALFLALAALFNIGGNPKIRNAVITRGGETTEFLEKFSKKMDKGEKFKAEFDFQAGSFGAWELQIVPDDCAERISVNGKELGLGEVEGLCDYRKGFTLTEKDLPKAGGENHFVVNLKNNGGSAGIWLLAKSTSLLAKGFTCLIALLLLGFFACILRRMHMPISLSAAVLLACLLHFSYTLDTNFEERAYDVNGHLEYVKFIAEKGENPAADACWSCYHPPVYYSVATLAWKLGNAAGAVPSRALQWLSFFISFFVLAFGVQALRSVLHGGTLFLAALLWLFWPVNTLVSARIGNDVLFYLGHVLCFFGALRYLEKRDSKFLVLAALGSWLAYWTKSTGFVTIAVWWFAFALGYFPRASFKPRRSEVLAFAVALLLLFSIAIHFGVAETSLIGNASRLSSKLKVEANAYNILFFDFKDFLTTAETSTRNDEGGRQFLLNYMAKTSLFGEFKLAKEFLVQTAATVICFSFLGLFIFAVAGFWKKALTKIDVFVLANGALFLAAMVYLRVKYPYACSSDFRYVVPALLSFVPYAALGICGEQFSQKWRALGGILAAAFILCAIVLGLTYD